MGGRGSYMLGLALQTAAFSPWGARFHTSSSVPVVLSVCRNCMACSWNSNALGAPLGDRRGRCTSAHASAPDSSWE